jgi:hypothetical protein
LTLPPPADAAKLRRGDPMKALLALVVLSSALAPSLARGQTVPAAPASQAPARIRIPEGTLFHFRLEDAVSSATSQAGDKFRVTMTAPTTLPDGTVIPAGYRGVGEVLDAQKSHTLGGGGGLSLKLRYLKIGDVEVRLRGAEAVYGNDRMFAATALSVTVIGGILVHGREVELHPGQALVAFVDEDALVPLPLPPPEAAP